MRFPTIQRGRGLRRPIVPIWVIAPNGRSLLVDALIDTGSDITLLIPGTAELLGLSLEGSAEKHLSSALNSVDRYRSVTLTLQLRRHPEVIEWNATVGVVQEHLKFCILGTRGFFEFFQFTYDASAEWFEVLPLPR